MLLKYFYDKSLAHASYMVGCQKTGEAILIDPERNIEPYLETAKREGMKIVGTAETHIHADYVSGSRELAEKTGAKIYVSDEGPQDWKYTFVEAYEHQLLREGDEFQVGKIQFKVMHTPGHTPESISFIVTDVGGGADKPMGMFTGDFVFVGSIGRPDLLEEAAGQAGTAEPGARQLYQSIQRFKELPDFLQIWPSHGAGSACGKGLGAIPSSTVGYEKLFNEALQFESEDDFVRYILSDQPEAPPYFAVMKHVNKHGPKVLGDEGLPAKLDVQTLPKIAADGQVIDFGAAKSFAQGHVPGVINVPLNLLAFSGNWFLKYDQPLYIVVDSDLLKETVRMLREIGIDDIAGYFDADQLTLSGLASETYTEKSPVEISEMARNQTITLLDVRKQTEWNEGHIPFADHEFLGNLVESVQNLSDSDPIVFQCRGGGRSAIACSVAQAHGLKNVINLSGGILAWEKANLPTVAPEPEPIG